MRKLNDFSGDANHSIPFFIRKRRYKTYTACYFATILLKQQEALFMRINFYDTRLSEDSRTILIKEKAVNYHTEKISASQDIVLLMQKLLHMDELAEEHCYMIALNSVGKILGVFFISKGTVNTSLVSPREIYIRALLAGAVQIIFCHNHPSGNVQPSESDIQLTQTLKKAGELMNISLTDHIIIGTDSYFSFCESQML